MSATQYVEEALIRHQIYLLRYSGTASRKVKAVLDDLVKSVNAVLLRESITDYQLAKYTKIREQVTALIGNMETGEAITDSAKDLAEYEAGFTKKLYQGAVSVDLMGVTAEQVIASVTSKPVQLLQGGTIQTQTINQLIDTFDQTAGKQILAKIQVGMLEGKSIDVIASDVSRLSKSQLYRNAEALARTVNLHVGSVARQAFYEQNSNVISKERFVATLDSRTTLVCAKNDGESFAIGQGPQPPLHYNAIPEGEIVKTVSGDKKIEDICVGEYVLTHRGRFKKVTATMSKLNETGFVREIEDISGRVARMTDDHPTLVSERGWISADGVKVGDEMHQYNSGVGHVNISSSSFVPENYPSIFDGSEVFSEVDVESTPVSTTINFKDKFNIWYSEISYRVFKNKLLFKDNSIFSKNTGKFNFVIRKVLKKSFPKCLQGFLSRLFVFCWVVVFHPYRCVKTPSARFFSASVSPVIFTTTNAFRNLFNCGTLTCLTSCHIFNVIFITPLSKLIVAKTKLSLNLSKWFTKFNIMVINKFRKLFSVVKVHSFSPFKVVSIRTVANTGKVYNLEVEEDNSYLVNGVIVHNCRSIRVAIIDQSFGIDSLSGQRPQIGSDGRGTTSAKTTFNSFFGRQSAEWQKDYLGPKRYALYKKGNLNISAFTDDLGRTLTIEELVAKENLTL